MKITDKKKYSFAHNFVYKDIVINDELKIRIKNIVVFRFKLRTEVRN
ncbi:MAG: hypothetical protein IPL53_08545 [Ignavibacteria bacterium]|nr:hypothetical protein [Ignavibacteria bacterium]